MAAIHTLLIGFLWLQLVQAAGKAGLPWASGPYVPMTAFQDPNSTVSWYYTWSASPVSYPRYLNHGGRLTTSPFAFVPQLWGIDGSLTTTFLQGIQTNFNGVELTPDRAILTYNECDQPGQAVCTPAAAAAHWEQYVEPLRASGWRVGSPVTTSAPRGKEWMRQFQGNCTGCDWDFTTIHWYDLDPQGFISYVNDFYESFNRKPIWVTEFACQNFNGDNQATLDEIQLFMNTTLNFLDSTSWIERYAYFAPAYDMVDVNPLNSLLANDTSDFQEKTGRQSELGIAFAKANGTAMLQGRTGNSLRGVASFDNAMAFVVLIWAGTSLL